MNSRFMLLVTAGMLICKGAVANALTEVTVYNQNLALVKKNEVVALKKGANDVVFKEVAQQMLPESVFVYGQGVNVLEQNYDYAGVNYMNMLNAYVGQKVKTVRVNPATGENVFETATLLAVNGMEPVLAFDYGVEAQFTGRVLFDKVPAELQGSPVLRVKIEAADAGQKELRLAYLTSGLSWQANYVAMVNDAQTLSLVGRAMVDNSSGTGYDGVKVNLIAGDINVVRNVMRSRALLKTAAVNSVSAAGAFDMAMPEAVMDEPDSLNGYYIYQIPHTTSLKDGQIKQVSFLSAPKVAYHKEGVLVSSLYFGQSKTSYKNVHPEVVYTFKNETEDGLGLPLPQGKVSFYDYDANGALQFVGENLMPHKAKGEEIKLSLGRFFDVYAEATVQDLSKTEQKRYKKTAGDRCDTVETTYEYDVIYTFVNQSAEPVSLRLRQPLPPATDIIQESLKGKAAEGSLYEWELTLAPAEKGEVKAKVVRRFSTDHKC